MNHVLQFKKNQIVMTAMLALSCVGYNVNAQVVQPQTPAPSVKAPTTAPAATPVAAPKAPTSAAPKAAEPRFEGSTFEKIKSSGKIVMAHRNIAPMSYLDANKKPIGYAVEICTNIIERIKEKLAMPGLQTEYVEVNQNNRGPFILSGKVDFECGLTSTSEERRKDFAFSVPYFMDGIRLVVKADSPITSIEDLRGQTLSMTKNTIALPLFRKLDKERVLGIKINEYDNYTLAFNELEKGNGVAWANPAMIGAGAVAAMPNPQNFKFVGDFLSVEPIAIQMRKDPEFVKFVNQEMVKMIKSGVIPQLYTKWLLNPVPPKNKAFNIPANPMLLEVFRMPTDTVGN